MPDIIFAGKYEFHLEVPAAAKKDSGGRLESMEVDWPPAYLSIHGSRSAGPSAPRKTPIKGRCGVNGDNHQMTSDSSENFGAGPLCPIIVTTILSSISQGRGFCPLRSTINPQELRRFRNLASQGLLPSRISGIKETF